MRDRLEGGRAAGMHPEDFDPVQLRIGTQVELEHTDDYWTAREIAMDHLAEHPNYYKALAEMENKLGVAPNAPAGHYVLIQEPRREGVYVRCKDAHQCLCVVERELKENMLGTRVTMFRKRRGEPAELIAVWHIEQGGPRRYQVNRTARQEKAMRYSTLRDQLRDSNAREKKARRAAKTALTALRSDCTKAKNAIAAERARLVARERAYRKEAKTDYRHAVGLAERSRRGRRYSMAESDDLAIQNLPPSLADLFLDMREKFPYDWEPDHRAERFIEWVEEHEDEVAAWQAERFQADDETYAAAYAEHEMS